MLNMSKQMYKYPIELRNKVQIIGLKGQSLTPRHAGVQNGTLTVWAECENEIVGDFETIIVIVPTGGEIPLACDYLGTVQMDEFVWHIYTRTSPI